MLACLPAQTEDSLKREITAHTVGPFFSLHFAAPLIQPHLVNNLYFLCSCFPILKTDIRQQNRAKVLTNKAYLKPEIAELLYP